MQRARNHGFISGKQDVSDSEDSREALSLSTVECIVLLTLWFIILSCLGRGNTRPSHNILLNRSIVHAIRLHVSEVPCSGAVSAHTACVPRPSPTEPRSGPPLPTRDASIRYSVSVSAPIRSFSADRVSERRDRSKSDIVCILFCVIVKPHESTKAL